jgi:hypothetical protein
MRLNLLAPRYRYLAACLVAVAFAGLAGCDSSSTTNPKDTTAPLVSSTNPIDGATGVAVITASFNESMDATTITTTTFALTGPGTTPVDGSVTYSAASDIARFAPTSALAANTTYTATIKTGVEDSAGNALASDHVWSFTTSAATPGQATLALGGATDFAVLAGSTVTNTGASVITGDLGVSPGTAVTGFPPGTVIGAIHAGNSTAGTGMADLTTAYNEVAGRTVAAVTVAGNLGGLTLPPGLYKSTSSLAITSGDLTLDAMGDPNAVFMFQIASTLTTSSSRSVVLIGGAKAVNVYWQVGSSATLGTETAFQGTILANQSITLNTGAHLNGRALTRIGAVTLASNAVVMPTP